MTRDEIIQSQDAARGKHFEQPGQKEIIIALYEVAFQLSDVCHFLEEIDATNIRIANRN